MGNVELEKEMKFDKIILECECGSLDCTTKFSLDKDEGLIYISFMTNRTHWLKRVWESMKGIYVEETIINRRQASKLKELLEDFCKED
jgi:hypothetical protein